MYLPVLLNRIHFVDLQVQSNGKFQVLAEKNNIDVGIIKRKLRGTTNTPCNWFVDL